MATLNSEALRQLEAARVTDLGLTPDLDGAPVAPSWVRTEPRCVMCMAEHLLAAANDPGANVARATARHLEAECQACLARPGGGR